MNVVYDATVWRTRGNYGSTKFDSFSKDEWLEAYICDACLVKKGKIVNYVCVTGQNPKDEKVESNTFEEYEKRI